MSETAEYACRRCGAVLVHNPGDAGRYAYTDRTDGTDIFGSGSECPQNERGHDATSLKEDWPKCAICSERIRFVAGVGWMHPHSGDRECWTGDGATAYPANVEGSEDS